MEWEEKDSILSLPKKIRSPWRDSGPLWSWFDLGIGVEGCLWFKEKILDHQVRAGSRGSSANLDYSKSCSPVGRRAIGVLASLPPLSSGVPLILKYNARKRNPYLISWKKNQKPLERLGSGLVSVWPSISGQRVTMVWGKNPWPSSKSLVKGVEERPWLLLEPFSCGEKGSWIE